MTAILAALASSADKIAITLEVAYCHLFFNISGILLFYVFWPMRVIPINAAKYMGMQTQRYRWYAVAYLFVCFFTVPGILVGLSLAHIAVMGTFVALAIAFFIAIGVIYVMQQRTPENLPEKLRTFEFLPVYMTSLEPLDAVLMSVFGKMMPGAFMAKDETAATEHKADGIEAVA